MPDENYSPEALQRALNSLSGKESLFGDLKDALGIGGSKVEQVKALGDGTLASRFSLGANTVARLTSQALGSNDGVIRALMSRVTSKPLNKVSIPGSTIGHLTATGDLADLVKDQRVLTDTISTVMRFQSDLESYGKASLTLMKELTKAKTNDDLIELTTRISLLKLPVLTLAIRKTDESYSELLPGNKIIKCETSNGVRYSMTGGPESLPSEEYQFDVSTINEFLKQSRWVNTQQKALSEIINHYSKHIQQWSAVVKDVQSNLDRTENLSNSIRNQITNQMALESSVVNFHTVFLPRLIAYLNNYVEQGNDLFTGVLK